MRAIWSLVRTAVQECREKKAQRLAAALAYYVMCSLAPLLILIVAITGMVYGEAASADRMVASLRTALGPVAGDAIGTLVRGFRTPRADLSTMIIGAAGLLFVASGLFNHLRDSLNTVWEVTSPPGHPLRGYLVSRLLATLTVLSVGAVALVGLILSITIEAAAHRLVALLPGDLPTIVLRAGQLGLTFGVVALLVALIYKILPDTTVAWRDIWVGAAATALLIVIGQALMGLYLRSGLVGSAYSLAGAVVIILGWVYYSALIFFFGAELTRAYANRFGARIVPAPGALSLSAGDRATQGLLRTSELQAAAERRDAEP